jgi:hypothetical protein
MPKGKRGTAQKLEAELKKATTTAAVKLVSAKADAYAKIQDLKK